MAGKIPPRQTGAGPAQCHVAEPVPVQHVLQATHGSGPLLAGQSIQCWGRWPLWAHFSDLLQAVIWRGTPTVRGWMGCRQESGSAQSAESRVRLESLVTPLLSHGQCLVVPVQPTWLSVRQHAQRLFADWSQQMFPCLHWVPANARGSAWLLVLDKVHCSHAPLLST